MCVEGCQSFPISLLIKVYTTFHCFLFMSLISKSRNCASNQASRRFFPCDGVTRLPSLSRSFPAGTRDVISPFAILFFLSAISNAPAQSVIMTRFGFLFSLSSLPTSLWPLMAVNVLSSSFFPRGVLQQTELDTWFDLLLPPRGL